MVNFEQKSYILRVIPLGIDLFTAGIQSGLSLEDIDELENDEAFMKEVTLEKAKEEARLLEIYRETAQQRANNPKMMDHKAIYDLLILLNPKKYGTKIVEDDRGNKSTVQILLPDNGRD